MPEPTQHVAQSNSNDPATVGEPLDLAGEQPVGLDLSNHLAVRAEMARSGIAPMHLQPWWSPETERDVVPMDDPETRQAITRFLGRVWKAAGG